MEPYLVYGAGRMQYEDLTQEPRLPKYKYTKPARAVAGLRRVWGSSATNYATASPTCNVTVPLPAERSLS